MATSAAARTSLTAGDAKESKDVTKNLPFIFRGNAFIDQLKEYFVKLHAAMPAILTEQRGWVLSENLKFLEIQYNEIAEPIIARILAIDPSLTLSEIKQAKDKFVSFIEKCGSSRAKTQAIVVAQMFDLYAELFSKLNLLNLVFNVKEKSVKEICDKLNQFKNIYEREVTTTDLKEIDNVALKPVKELKTQELTFVKKFESFATEDKKNEEVETNDFKTLILEKMLAYLSDLEKRALDIPTEITAADTKLDAALLEQRKSIDLAAELKARFNTLQTSTLESYISKLEQQIEEEQKTKVEDKFPEVKAISDKLTGSMLLVHEWKLICQDPVSPELKTIAVQYQALVKKLQETLQTTFANQRAFDLQQTRLSDTYRELQLSQKELNAAFDALQKTVNARLKRKPWQQLNSIMKNIGAFFSTDFILNSASEELPPREIDKARTFANIHLLCAFHASLLTLLKEHRFDCERVKEEKDGTVTFTIQSKSFDEAFAKFNELHKAMCERMIKSAQAEFRKQFQESQAKYRKLFEDLITQVFPKVQAKLELIRTQKAALKAQVEELRKDLNARKAIEEARKQQTVTPKAVEDARQLQTAKPKAEAAGIKPLFFKQASATDLKNAPGQSAGSAQTAARSAVVVTPRVGVIANGAGNNNSAAALHSSPGTSGKVVTTPAGTRRA